MSIEILNRWTSAVLYSSETAQTIAEAVVEAVSRGAYLEGAYLGRAYLRGAYLEGAYLGRANLGGAYLGDANLGGANLGGANLRGAYLGGAYLGGANLGRANLEGANLEGANLRGAKGLLPNGIIPLQIGGSRHWIIVRTPGFITIGCEHHEVEWWEEHYGAVGRREQYTQAQITEYRKHIQYAKEWMEQNGVLEAVKEEAA